MSRVLFSVDPTLSDQLGWYLGILHHLFSFALSSSLFFSPASELLWLRLSGLCWELLLRDCLQLQPPPARFQRKGKAIPCLGHSESVSVSSASRCPQITHTPTPSFPHSPSEVPSASAALWSGSGRASAWKGNEDALYMLPNHTILLDVTHFCSLALAISCCAIKRCTSQRSSNSL